MSALSSAAHLHFLAKSQKIVREVNTQFWGFFSMVYKKTSALLHLAVTVTSSWGAAAKSGVVGDWTSPEQAPGGVGGWDDIGRVPATKFLSSYKWIKQQRSSFTVFGKRSEAGIRWWPFMLWYLISESPKSLLFVNRASVLQTKGYIRCQQTLGFSIILLFT